MSKYLTSFAGAPAYNSDYATQHRAYALDGTDASGQTWRRVFRSHARLLDAAKAEREALAELPERERAACNLRAYRVVGSGPDARTEHVRV